MSEEEEAEGVLNEGGGEGAEGGESEPDEPEEKVEAPKPVEAAPTPRYPVRRMDPLSSVMNLNKELDFLSTQINHTCTMLKYQDYGKNVDMGYGMSGMGLSMGAT
jgi:hypothetical protein